MVCLLITSSSLCPIASRAVGVRVLVPIYPPGHQRNFVNVNRLCDHLTLPSSHCQEQPKCHIISCLFNRHAQSRSDQPDVGHNVQLRQSRMHEKTIELPRRGFIHTPRPFAANPPSLRTNPSNHLKATATSSPKASHPNSPQANTPPPPPSPANKS